MKTADTPTPPRRILIATITTAHGIRGEVMLRTYTAEPEAITGYGVLRNAAGSQVAKITSIRVTPKGVIARLAGVADRNQAEALRGTDLYVARDQLPEPADQEYYHADLIGLKALDPAGSLIGDVIGVANFGAGDLLEIRKTGEKQTEYIAFTAANVPHVDIAAGTLTVVIPESVGEQEPASEGETGDPSDDEPDEEPGNQTGGESGEAPPSS